MPDLIKPTGRRPRDVTSAYQPITGSEQPRKKSRLFWLVITLIIVMVGIGTGLAVKLVVAINSTSDASGKKIGFFEQIRHLIANPEATINGEADDRINILLLGNGGAGHPGAYLADTIIVASLKPSTNEMATISIPRDLYVEIPEYGSRKINNALAFGYDPERPGAGEQLLKQVVENVTGLPIHYYLRVDFEGFRKAIDDLGGIEVTVDKSFSDYQFPDYSYGYQAVTFKAGPQQMNGERALQYVRSRHGTNGEGSDFARSLRQQKVLLALKEKFFSLNSLINPAAIVSALNDLGKHHQTNLQIWEIVRLAKLGQDISQDDLISVVLDSSTNSPLYATHTQDGAYILLPRAGDFSEVKTLAKTVFERTVIKREQARIEIANGTGVTGLAQETADQLTALNYQVVTVSNAPTNVSTTTIYDLARGAKPKTIVGLKGILGAPVATSLPAELNSRTPTNTETASPADIVIVLGADYETIQQLSGSPASIQ